MPKVYRPEIVDRLRAHRHHRRPDLADAMERQRGELIARARHLDPADRALLEMHLVRGLPLRRLGELLGTNSGQLSRRIASLRRRLTSPIVVALANAAIPLSEGDRQMALAHFLNRRTIRSLAREFDLTPPIVRKRLNFIRGWAHGRRDGARAMKAAIDAAREA